MGSDFINYDGINLRTDSPVLKFNNRGFLYGDALFETMVSFEGNIPFIDDHLNRLTKSMTILKMRVPYQFNKNFFSDQIDRLSRANKYFKTNRVRITVFRKEGGLYTPDTLEVSYLIEIKQLIYSRFTLNPEGLTIDIFKDHLKPINGFSSIKSTNDLLFVMAGIYKKERGVDDCIIFNSNNFICESISSNVFLVKNNIIYTPSLESGCLPGVMRKNIIELAKNNDIKVQEVSNLTLEHLFEADECFLTNAVTGITWVSGYKNIRFFNKMSGFLVNELNKITGLI